MPAKSLKERALFYAHGFNPALRLFLNPTIIMHIICYLKTQWESGRVGEWESGRVGTYLVLNQLKSGSKLFNRSREVSKTCVHRLQRFGKSVQRSYYHHY